MEEVNICKNSQNGQQWDLESCKKYFSDCKNRTEMRKKNQTLWKLASKNHWLNDFSERRASRYDYDKCKEIAEQCESRTELAYKNAQVYRKSLAKGWIDDFKFKGKS